MPLEEFSSEESSEESSEKSSEEVSSEESSEESNEGNEEYGNYLVHLGYRREDNGCPEGQVLDIYGYCR